MDDKRFRHHFGVWLALLILLALNIAGSRLDLGAANPALTLAIAAIQAFLIVAFFMYIRKAAPVPRIAAGTGFLWLFLMIGLTLSDYRSRPEDIALGRLLPESGPKSTTAGEQVYRSICAVCHGTGALGAPKAGDNAAWRPRFEHGMDTLVSRAVNGYKAMPPKGGHPELSEQDIRDAIDYMLSASGIDVPVRNNGSD